MPNVWDKICRKEYNEYKCERKKQSGNESMMIYSVLWLWLYEFNQFYRSKRVIVLSPTYFSPCNVEFIRYWWMLSLRTLDIGRLRVCCNRFCCELFWPLLWCNASTCNRDSIIVHLTHWRYSRKWSKTILFISFYIRVLFQLICPYWHVLNIWFEL